MTDRAVMDQDQDGNAIQVLPLRVISGDDTDGAFAPIALASGETETLDVSSSALLRFEAKDADGALVSIFFGIDSEMGADIPPAAGKLYELKSFDVIGCSAVETVRFTNSSGTDVTIYGRRS